MFLVSVQFEVLFSTWKNSGFKTVSGKVNVILKTFLKKLEKFHLQVEEMPNMPHHVFILAHKIMQQNLSATGSLLIGKYTSTFG